MVSQWQKKQTDLRRRAMGVKSRSAKKRRPKLKNVRSGGYQQYQAVRSSLNQKLYFKDVGTNATEYTIHQNWASAGNIITGQPLNLIDQGPGPSQRLGSQVIYRKLWVEGAVTLAPQETVTTPCPNDRVKIYLILDKQCNGAALAGPSDVLSGINSIPKSNALELMKNMQNSQRFRILDQIELDMTPVTNMVDLAGAGYAHGGAVQSFNLNWRGKMRGNFTGDGGTVANIVDNAFYIIAVRSHVIGAAGPKAALNITFAARFRYEA